MLPYGPPPHFKGRPDEDLEDWMLLYERYATALSWTEAQKANNLVFALEDEARHWFSTALREATAEAPLTTWEQWQQALRRDFAGEHVRDWAFMQLQERRQQLNETPQHYVSSILQLCARATPTMADTEKVRCLLRGLRPEMMERVAISNPRTPADFLQHLQRLTHVGAMARQALFRFGSVPLRLKITVRFRFSVRFGSGSTPWLAMPTHELPGFAAPSPFSRPRPTAQARTPAADAGLRPNSSDAFHVQGPGAPQLTEDTTAILGALQDSVRALTMAVEQLGRARQRSRRVSQEIRAVTSFASGATALATSSAS
ncbi:unnamed protein product, partial [Ixodes hexagonus]